MIYGGIGQVRYSLRCTAMVGGGWGGGGGGGGGANEQLHVWAGLGDEHNTRFGIPQSHIIPHMIQQSM